MYSLGSVYKGVLPLPPNCIQHRARASHNAQDNLRRRLLDPPAYTRGLHSRKVEEPEPSKERGQVGHDGFPFQKVGKRLCTGDIMGGDAQAGKPREVEESGEGEGWRREGVVEEDPVGDC